MKQPKQQQRTVSAKRLREALNLLKKNPGKACSLKNSAYLCSALLLSKATESPTTAAAGFFIAVVQSITA